MENLIQQEMIKAVLIARENGEDIKETIKELAQEFNLTEFMVKGIIEHSAMYGLEQICGPKTWGKKWRPIDYTKAIKRLEDKIYELHTLIVKTNNRINKELGIRESRWLPGRLSELESRESLSEAEELAEPSESQEDEGIPKGQILVKAHEVVGPNQREEWIKELRGTIDRVRNRLQRKEEGPSLIFRDLQRKGE